MKDDILKGAVGLFASAGGFVMSILPQIEAWLRVASLAAGLVVACLSIYSLVLGIRHKRSEHKSKKHK